MTKRIALATSAELAELHPDDRPLLDALRAEGLDPVVEVWTDPSVDWSVYDAVLLRTVWDYFLRYDEFTEWLAQLGKAEVPLLNSADQVRWNSDKQYLLELRERGVAIVPSQVAAGACLHEVVAGLNGQQVVIKPTVSGNALHTIRGVAGSPSSSRRSWSCPTWCTSCSRSSRRSSPTASGRCCSSTASSATRS